MYLKIIRLKSQKNFHLIQGFYFNQRVFNFK